MKPASSQRGMSMVVAIFLITVIASLAAFAVTIGSATHESANLQLQADRALIAARAGTEWGAYRARQAVPVCPAAATTFNLNQNAFRGFRVTVTCTRQGVAPNFVYDIDAYAQWSNFGVADYAYRRVSKRVW